MKGSVQSFWDMDPHDVRQHINQSAMAIEAEKPEVFAVKDLTITQNGLTVPLRIYTPNDAEELPIILLIHGGAWVGGNLDTHDNLARYLCRGVQALVVSVDYLNAPEGKFPFSLDQCYEALLWTVAHANAHRLAVVGDSAGGNMAAALCLMDRDRKGPNIALQVLINPATDLTGNGTISKQGDELDEVRWYVTQYVADPQDANDPYVSPIVAPDLRGLPPALVILAENDALRADGQKYADRLKAAGVPTNVYTQWNMGHLAGNGARASLQAQESLDVAIAALRGCFRETQKEIRSTMNQK